MIRLYTPNLNSMSLKFTQQPWTFKPEEDSGMN